MDNSVGIDQWSWGVGWAQKGKWGKIDTTIIK